MTAILASMVLHVKNKIPEQKATRNSHPPQSVRAIFLDPEVEAREREQNALPDSSPLIFLS